VDRNIEIITALIGAAMGALVAGGIGAAIGGVAGIVVATAGVKALRRQTNGYTIQIGPRVRAEIESSMHLAIAASWALRPVIETEPFLQRQIAQRLFDQVVASYTSDVTPYVKELQLHLQRVIHSGIKPEDSLEHVRRTYAPRMFRKDDTVSFMIAKHVMMIQSTYGPLQESWQWFERWCQAVGLGRHAQGIWNEQFKGEPLRPMQEWKEARHRAAVESYYSDDEAA
jgi:hypothetical protein